MIDIEEWLLRITFVILFIVFICSATEGCWGDPNIEKHLQEEPFVEDDGRPEHNWIGE